MLVGWTGTQDGQQKYMRGEGKEKKEDGMDQWCETDIEV